MIEIGFMAIVNLIKHIYHYRHQHHDFLTSHACKNYHYSVLSILHPYDEYCQPLAPAEIAITTFYPSFNPLMNKVSEGDCCNFLYSYQGPTIWRDPLC